MGNPQGKGSYLRPFLVDGAVPVVCVLGGSFESCSRLIRASLSTESSRAALNIM